VRPLTARQVITCENAQTNRCACRCGGELHGAARSRIPEYFEILAQDDPHWKPEQSRQLPLPQPVGMVA
jgi:hypothetical protein